MNSQDWATGAALGGLLLAVLMKNRSLAQPLINKKNHVFAKTPMAKAQRQVANQAMFSKPIGRVVSNVAIPRSYSIPGLIGATKVMAKNPLQTAKSIIKNEPVYLNSKIGNKVIDGWASGLKGEQGKKHAKRLLTDPDYRKGEIKLWNLRQRPLREGFDLKNPKKFQEESDAFVKTGRKTLDFNYNNPTGKKLANEVKNAETGKGHPIFGNYTRRKNWDGTVDFEDTFDFGINPGENSMGANFWTKLWRKIKTPKTSADYAKVDNDFFDAAKYHIRDKVDYFMDPVKFKGTVDPRDLL